MELELDRIFDADRLMGVLRSRLTWSGQRHASARAIMPDDLPGDWRVEWEERAAIREYDGLQHREYAEAEALTEILQRMRAAGEGV